MAENHSLDFNMNRARKNERKPFCRQTFGKHLGTGTSRRNSRDIPGSLPSKAKENKMRQRAFQPPPLHVWLVRPVIVRPVICISAFVCILPSAISDYVFRVFVWQTFSDPHFTCGNGGRFCAFSPRLLLRFATRSPNGKIRKIRPTGLMFSGMLVRKRQKTRKSRVQEAIRVR